jgi:hypothetical protein
VWKDNIEEGIKEISCEGVDWFQLTWSPVIGVLKHGDETLVS